MSRHENEDSGSAKIYVGHLGARTNPRDLEDIFAKYGVVRNVEIKPAGYGFIEFEDPRDAEDAVNALNGYMFEDQRLLVEFSRRGGSANSNCFICGQTGHWVRECPENTDKGLDVRSGKCFKCGEVGHLAKYCRRPGGGGGDRGRSRSPPPRRRSHSRSPGGWGGRRRSPSPRGGYERRPMRHASPPRYRGGRGGSPPPPPPPRRGGYSPRRDYGGRDRDGPRDGGRERDSYERDSYERRPMSPRSPPRSRY
ncbi:hypothetical protein DFS34DRAFT_615888 [Phlyctochytrium arcticum]|nr:hypothetical protein DFS34DRAFT_615888 [Phlyctochytrium arcticum]